MESGCSRAFNISELPQSTTVSCTQANSDSAHAAVCKWQHGTAQPMATASTSMYGLDHSWAVGKCQHGVHESIHLQEEMSNCSKFLIFCNLMYKDHETGVILTRCLSVQLQAEDVFRLHQSQVEIDSYSTNQTYNPTPEA